MKECDKCGTEESMPYTCRRCEGTFCSEHRLPENHDCDESAVEEDDSSATATEDTDTGIVQTVKDAVPTPSTSRSSSSVTWFDALGQNFTFLFLALIWITFFAEIIVLQFFGEELFSNLFVLQSEHIAYVWTWFTSIFAHDPGGLAHILLNSLVLYFFGPVVERRIGSKRFVTLFLVSGAVAGLAQVITASMIAPPTALPTGVLGASGAIMAVMGVLTVLNPNLRVYLWFLIPVPLWLLTFGFAGYSVLIGLTAGVGAGGVAQFAHLGGIIVGLAYGAYLDRNDETAPDQLRLGGGGRGGPGRRY